MKTILFFYLLALALWAAWRHLRKKRKRSKPRLPEPKVFDDGSLLVRGSYVYGTDLHDAATDSQTEDSANKDVTFADEGSRKSAEDGTAPLPGWDALNEGPMVILGPENEDGTPNEIEIEPPTPIAPQTPVDEKMEIIAAELYADEPEPALDDMTEGERQQVEHFDVEAFR